MSDAAAALLACLVGGIFGLLGVWMGFALSRIATEKDREKEALFKIYYNVEVTKNLLIAFRKQMIGATELHPKWNDATENILVALMRTGLNSKEKKRILLAINGKWEDSKSVTELNALGSELLTKLDPAYAQAASELLEGMGVKPEDVNPTIVRR
jgi:hypothetical protein